MITQISNPEKLLKAYMKEEGRKNEGKKEKNKKKK